MHHSFIDSLYEIPPFLHGLNEEIYPLITNENSPYGLKVIFRHLFTLILLYGVAGFTPRQACLTACCLSKVREKKKKDR